jgi:diguanylate cyclase (GGDEF)-like protein
MNEYEDTDIKILVVDDEPSVREIITFGLESEGYIVFTASDGVEAIDKSLEVQPDLIILDIMMPMLDGLQVARVIRGNFRTSYIPIIMVSAKGDINDKILGMQTGADDYITKPFKREELIARVEMVLRRTEEHRDRNPLTGLPGNISIKSTVEKALDNNEMISVMYVDIDNFKTFNDYYGYARGDEIIKLLSRIIIEAEEKFGTHNDLIGHIGGDDFIIVTDSTQVKEMAQYLIDNFNEESYKHFDEKDVKRGYFETKDRQDELKRYDVGLTLTIALVENWKGRYDQYLEITDTATELKKYGKSQGGNRYIVDKRYK